MARNFFSEWIRRNHLLFSKKSILYNIVNHRLSANLITANCFTHDFQNLEWPNVDSANRLDSYKTYFHKTWILEYRSCIHWLCSLNWPPPPKKKISLCAVTVRFTRISNLHKLWSGIHGDGLEISRLIC